MKKALILLVVLVLLAGLLFGLYHFLWTADNFAALGREGHEERQLCPRG